MAVEGKCCRCGAEALAKIEGAWYCFSCGIEFHPIGLPHGRPCQTCAKTERERDEFRTQYHKCFAELVATATRASLAERGVLDAQRERDDVVNGQEALRLQTVRIRRALTDVVEDGVDTEEIAKRVRRERDEAVCSRVHRRITGMERDFRERLSLLEGERSRAVARSEKLALSLRQEQHDHQKARNRAFDAERDLAEARKKIVELDNDRKEERRDHLSDHNRVVDAESKQAAVLAEARFSECAHCGWTGHFGSERECPCCHEELSPIHLSITDVLRRLQRTPRVS